MIDLTQIQEFVEAVANQSKEAARKELASLYYSHGSASTTKVPDVYLSNWTIEDGLLELEFTEDINYDNPDKISLSYTQEDLDNLRGTLLSIELGILNEENEK